MRRCRCLMLLLIVILLVSLFPSGAAASSNAWGDPGAKSQFFPLDAIPLEARVKIEPALLKQLLEAGQDAQIKRPVQPKAVTYLVHLREQAPLQDLAQVPDAKNRRALVVSRLQSVAQQSQKGIVAYLEQRVAQGKVSSYRSYWIFNGLAVNGDLQTAIELARWPEVEFIRANRKQRLLPLSAETQELAAQPPWGIRKIGADRVWRELGITGEGVVVANLDSGVDWTHPALQRQYRGYNAANPAASTHDYNWFDVTGAYPTSPGPNRFINDYASHGTHTMGTMVGATPDGSEPIGVAPDARWIAVKVFDDYGTAYDEWIHAGFQWILAPTNLRGMNPDPNRAPDILSNSWGDADGRNEVFARDVAALRAAGIFTVFAAGNEGPGSGTIGSPASYPHAFAVGATDAQDRIASFSSRGPSPWREIKPDVSAPGVGVRSAIPGGSYDGNWSGTSMATPHVAGLAALMAQAARQTTGQPALLPLSFGGTLNITATEQTIERTALDLGRPGADNDFGQGRIDAYQAVSTIIRRGAFAGRVVEAGTGRPLGDVLIIMRNLATGGQATTLTLADGSYAFDVAEGLYNVTASKFGYEDALAYSVQILARTTTQLDFTLSPRPVGLLNGHVTRSTDGQPVTATITLLGTPLQVSTDARGYYTCAVPIGTYTVSVTANAIGYRGSQVRDVVIAAQRLVTLNLACSPAPRLLLVNAEGHTASPILYYQAALNNLLYTYHTRAIMNPPVDNPSAGELGEYDVVIWSQPTGSPGYINAWSALATYLNRGGRLFISGQNIGYWDGGSANYADYLHARYVNDNGGLLPMAGSAEELLAGIQLTYNTPDSAGNQQSPDTIMVGDAIGRAIIGWSSGAIAGLRGDACTHRTVYLSFGLEGTGPAAARQQALERAIEWLAAARPSSGVGLAAPVSLQAAELGSVVRYDLALTNDGQVADRYMLSVESPAWPARLIDPATRQVVTQTGILAPCASLALQLEVRIPASAASNQVERTIVRVVSVGYPQTGAQRAFQTVALRPWGRAADLPTPRYRLAVAGIGCALYAIGGFVGGGPSPVSDRVEILDLTTDTWSQGARKPTAVANAAAVVLNGRIYVIGGYLPDPERFLDVVEVYNPPRDRWERVASLPTPLSGVAAAVWGGKIYVFGGNGPGGDSDATFVYDPSTNSWSRAAPLPEGRVSFGGAVGWDRMIYLMGGWPNRNQLWAYDPASDSWTSLAPMRTGRHSFALIARGGYLYVAGGGQEWNELGSVERYDIQNDTWIDLLSLRSRDRAGTSGAYADGRFYVVGGINAGTNPIVEYLDIDVPLSGSSFAVDLPLSRAGDTLRYTLALRNAGATSVTASWVHTLPVELGYVEGSATGGAVYDPRGRTLSWAGQVAATQTAPFGFAARVRDDVANESVITSSVTLRGGGCAAQTLTTATHVSMPLLDRSAKLVDKTRVAPGDNLRYTIQIANASPYTIGDALMTDPIPDHTSYVPGSVVGATYNAALRRIEWRGTLPPAPTSRETFDWVDATSGRRLSLTDDSCSGPLDLGFSFKFYDRVYTQIYVNSNGMVLFDRCNTSYSNVPIPNAAEPNNFVAPLWDDLTPGSGGVYYATFGTAPNRYAVVEWHGVSFYGASLPQTFEVILYEGSNSVVFQYLSLSGPQGSGSSATVGIENRTGSAGVQYLYNGSPPEHTLHNGLVVELAHDSTRRTSEHLVTFDVRVDEAIPPLTVITNVATIDDRLRVHQRSASSAVDSPSFVTSSKRAQPERVRSGDVITYTLNIVNSGTLAASDANLVDALPVELDYILDSLSGEGASYNAAQRRIEWQGQVPIGRQVTISYRARVNSRVGAQTRITNTALLWERGVLMANMSAGVSVNEVNLSTSAKAAGVSEALAGAPITYTISVVNSGLSAAQSVAVTDALPSELSLVEGSLQGGIYDVAQRTITWQGALPPAARHVIRFQARTALTTPNGTIVTNTALIDDGLGQVLARAAAVTIRRADLSESDMFFSPAGVLPGRLVTCTFRLRNTGPTDTSASLRYTAPASLTILPGSVFASSGAVTATERGLSWDGAIISHGMVVVRVVAVVSPSAPLQPLLNEATLVDADGVRTTLRATLQIGSDLFLPIIFRHAAH